MRFTLTAREDSDTGELGWQDSRICSDAYGPMPGGIGLAHDIMEHMAFRSVADEIEAHGAMYWLRYEGGYMSPYGRPLSLRDFGSEWINLYHGLETDSYMPIPRKTRSLDSRIEQEITEIMEIGRHYIASEYPQEYKNDILERIESVFRAYFRIGYRKAARRYKASDACSLSHLFGTLAKDLERYKPEFEYQKLVVVLDIKACRVKISEPTLDNDY